MLSASENEMQLKLMKSARTLCLAEEKIIIEVCQTDFAKYNECEK